MSHRGASLLAVAIAIGCGVPVEGVGAGGDGSGEASTRDGGSSEDSSSSESTGGSLRESGGDGDDTTSGSTTAPVEAPQVRVEAGEIDDAELVQRLPVGTSEGSAKRRVVLRLSPDDLPDLTLGDRLITPAEVQVTTRCDVGQTAPGCGYDPKIRAQLLLTGASDDVDPAGPESHALSDAMMQTCTKNEHHCMFVFRPDDATRVLDEALPCLAAGDCRVNLVMWAWDGNARPGDEDEVVVGGNEGNYLDNHVVEGDRARLMAVRERGITMDDRDLRESSGNGTRNVPTTAEPVLVYSHTLAGDVRRDEQFVVEVKIVASVGSRARVSTEMFLTTNGNATDGGSFDAIAPRQIGEHNGINCLPSHGRCTLRKVAVFRAREDIAGPLHVNVIVKSAVPGGGTTSVVLHRDDGWVRSTRYAAELHD
jgi:hypothetical protein